MQGRAVSRSSLDSEHVLGAHCHGLFKAVIQAEAGLSGRELAYREQRERGVVINRGGNRLRRDRVTKVRAAVFRFALPRISVLL